MEALLLTIVTAISAGSGAGLCYSDSVCSETKLIATDVPSETCENLGGKGWKDYADWICRDL